MAVDRCLVLVWELVHELERLEGLEQLEKELVKE